MSHHVGRRDLRHGASLSSGCAPNVFRGSALQSAAMAAIPVAPRSLAGIAMLEGLQKRESGRSGIYRDPDSDPRVLKEIAERQLMAERLDRETSRSVTALTDALVTLVGEPGYEAAVEARVAAMAQYFLARDGDMWSKYERPDHRKRLSDLVVTVEAAAAA